MADRAGYGRIRYAASRLVLNTIRDAWQWCGLDAAEVIDQNEFGNLLVADQDGKVWRICPEELSCEVVADNRDALSSLLANPDFRASWEMRPLVAMARERLGDLADGQCYCLKLPGPLGGSYDETNLATITREELVAFAGDVSRQIRDVPDGVEVEIKIVD